MVDVVVVAGAHWCWERTLMELNLLALFVWNDCNTADLFLAVECTIICRAINHLGTSCLSLGFFFALFSFLFFSSGILALNLFTYGELLQLD